MQRITYYWLKYCTTSIFGSINFIWRIYALTSFKLYCVAPNLGFSEDLNQQIMNTFCNEQYATEVYILIKNLIIAYIRFFDNEKIVEDCLFDVPSQQIE